jgi:hypothetical protein
VSTIDLSPSAGAPAITAAYRRSTTGRVRASMQWLKQHLLLVVAVPVAAALAVAGAAYYWKVARFVVSTDDAYVQADGQRYIDTVKLLLAAGGRIDFNRNEHP